MSGLVVEYYVCNLLILKRDFQSLEDIAEDQQNKQTTLQSCNLKLNG